MVQGFLLFLEVAEMNTNSLIALTEKNIRQALEDYRAHTYQTEVLDDVSDIFIEKLAADSVKAKTNLRNLFSKSGTWNENLQAIVKSRLYLSIGVGAQNFQSVYGRI